ncbi:hypothetical protein HOLleu_26051 [Holothuria leucospilota]|uniref:Uncharacterized protein n=1 Tax=Holothuria leucospilota TaxID=206669 RepID=A0A9Q1H4Y7_HOLLE|nr:hypothetical protein HOLleu_26051 [Holothuria leucospilota]
MSGNWWPTYLCFDDRQSSLWIFETKLRGLRQSGMSLLRNGSPLSELFGIECLRGLICIF